MNRRWSLLAVCVLLAACSVLQPRRVLIAWHAFSGAQERAFLDLVDRWNRANPTSAFIVPERHSPDALHRAMLGGPRPALALVEPAQAALYAQRDLLVTLNRFAEDDDPAIGWQADDRADLFPFVFQAGLRPDGRLIGLPFGGDIGLILANRALLGEAQMPQNWEAFDALCDKATDQLLGTFCFGFDLNDGRALEDWLRARGAPIYDPSTRQPALASAGVGAAIVGRMGVGSVAVAVGRVGEMGEAQPASAIASNPNANAIVPSPFGERFSLVRITSSTLSPSR